MSPHFQEDKPCRACTDFKSWAKTQNKKDFKESPSKTKTKGAVPLGSEIPGSSKGCPLDKENLGRQTWSFLHTMAAYYPEKPTKGQADDMVRFFNIFAQFYPCDYCAEDMRAELKKHPPKTKSRHEFEQWLCERHNHVNAKLQKPLFDCSTVQERWRDGWKDGSCD